MAKKVNSKDQVDLFLKLSNEEKLEDITKIRNFVTLNGISKDTLKAMLDWLYDEAVEVVTEEE